MTEQLTLFDVVEHDEVLGRLPLDAYYSPYWYPTHAMKILGEIITGSVLECCAGQLAIANVLKLYPQITEVFTNDINPNLQTDFQRDATKKSSWLLFPKVDFVVTNPPYNEAIEILKLAHEHAGKGVLMFLRQSFTEPTDDRAFWLSEFLPTIQIDLPRFKFRENVKTGKPQTDNVTISAYFWSKEGLPMNRFVCHASTVKNYYDRPDRTPAWDVIVKQVEKETGSQ